MTKTEAADNHPCVAGHSKSREELSHLAHLIARVNDWMTTITMMMMFNFYQFSMKFYIKLIANLTIFST